VLKTKFCPDHTIQDWARNHSGDPEIDEALKKGEDAGLALVSTVIFLYVVLSGICIIISLQVDIWK
jgi:hypothetical protein